MANKVEFIIKGLDGVFYVADVKDFPYRLNRTAFDVSTSKLKSLGGTYSTKVKLSKKSKTNSLIFVGKTSIASFAKFNSNNDYEAIIKENGSEVARGTFKLKGVYSDAYEGVFFDKDSNFIDKLSKVSLNKLGYVNNKPTWLAPFDGAISFDEINDLSNRETDFICPTIVYNNTPVLDYLDLGDNDIWGEYDFTQTEPERVNRGLSLPNDFDVVSGFPSTLRMGLKFNHFPPALYYRNVIEKVFEEVGLAVDCSLFYEDWFNALYMTYEGSKYIYNWKNIGSVYSVTPSIMQLSDLIIDELKQTEVGSTIEVNKLELIPVGNNPTRFWIRDEQFTFKIGNIIKHNALGGFIDKCTLTNSFDRVGQYSVPVSGKYKISVASQYEGINDNFTVLPNGNPNAPKYWVGSELFRVFGTWDANSDSNTPFNERRFASDDNVLIILRKDSRGNESAETRKMLFEWMNGQSKDFTTVKSDCIAYFSPKRWVLNDSVVPIPSSEIMGSPYSEFESTVKVGFGGGSSEFVSHEIVEALKYSKSTAEIEIEIELNEGDLVEIFWISLGNVFGEATRAPGSNAVYEYALPLLNMEQNFGAAIVDTTPPVADKAYYSIDYLCGEYDLDLAANLPDISGKDFIDSFIKERNLHYKVSDRMISFYPVAQYYSQDSYDITSRVDIGKGYKSDPISTPKSWLVGYNNDTTDRLLPETRESGCRGDLEVSADYANVKFSSENIHGKNELKDVSMFSATKFFRSSISTNPYGFDLSTFPYEFPESCSPINSSLCLIKGFVLTVPSLNGEIPIDFPSIQSEESFKIKKYGNWSLTFNYSPRLLYHLGTANQFTQDYSGAEWGTLIDMPRSNINFMNLRKHWFRPTLSQFDGENATLSGTKYPTLRYDGENGIYLKFFENSLELYSLSETLTLKMSITTKDWNNMEGSKRIRFLDQIYRLMSIKDYDVTKRNLSIIKLLKEV